MAWYDYIDDALAAYDAYDKNKKAEKGGEFKRVPMSPEEQEIYKRYIGFVDNSPTRNYLYPQIQNILQGYNGMSFDLPGQITDFSQLQQGHRAYQMPKMPKFEMPDWTEVFKPFAPDTSGGGGGGGGPDPNTFPNINDIVNNTRPDRLDAGDMPPGTDPALGNPVTGHTGGLEEIMSNMDPATPLTPEQTRAFWDAVGKNGPGALKAIGAMLGPVGALTAGLASAALRYLSGRGGTPRPPAGTDPLLISNKPLPGVNDAPGVQKPPWDVSNELPGERQPVGDPSQDRAAFIQWAQDKYGIGPQQAMALWLEWVFSKNKIPNADPSMMNPSGNPIGAGSMPEGYGTHMGFTGSVPGNRGGGGARGLI